ncbi:sensor histidine kinase [Saccharophagus degradans]|uniref:sensor histidine kinase n=1 Tax=Saccharophagus degradans TaxID=86304 RepID=UPI002477FDEF|nr:sensor histidine kinase [Saccharophagus degradans]WGO98438.1 sensor histidine kinase [Saccharophagus degradans]
MRELLDDLPFEISARVPIQLGRESISNSTVAISELIKNSYDADAESVELQFVTSESGKNCLIIDDDGLGMDYQILTENWLKIGTDYKNSNPYSKGKGRVLTGAKGLGRLGVDRLCSVLKLQTRTDSMSDVLELVVDWEKYENTDLSLSEIKHSVYRVDLNHSEDIANYFSEGRSGTRLILEDLKDDWDINFLESLKRELSLLLSPFSGVNDFSIEISSGYPEIDGFLTSEQFLDVAPWEVEASISQSNMVSLRMRNSETDSEFKIEEIPWANWIKTRGLLPKCGPVTIKLFYIPESKSVKDQVKGLDFHLKDLKAFMKANHGVRIYRDSFRVRPYGEPSGKGDWMNLGLRKASSPGGIVQGGWKVAPRQLIGAVFISRIGNAGLYDQANREGLLEGDEFYDLRAFTLSVIERFEWTAHKVAKQASKGDSIEDIKFDFDTIMSQSKESVTQLKLELQERFPSKKNKSKKSRKDQKKNRILLKRIHELEKNFNETQEALSLVTARAESVEEEKDTLQNLASLGILSVSFGHETKEYSNIAAAKSYQLLKDFDKNEKDLSLLDRDWWRRSLETIKKNTKFVQGFAGFSLENVKPSKRRIKGVKLPLVLKRVIHAIGESLNRQNIEVDFSGLPDDLPPVTGYEIDWESIFINLISNSIWAINANTESEIRKIKISAKQLDNRLEIIVSDTGIGLEDGTEAMIFTPMYSTRKDREGNSDGTGMGLAIVSSFIENHSNGSIRAINKGELGGAEFVITVKPRE